MITQNRTEQNRTEQNHYYLLTNNLNFYILQAFKTFNFLSADFRFCGLLALLQKLFSNIIKRLFIFEFPKFKQNFIFARNIYLNVFIKKLNQRSFL